MALKLNSEITSRRGGDTFKFNPLQLIPHFPSYTGRVGRTDEQINEMAKSLLRMGQELPIKFRKNFEGFPVVVSGFTRVLAAAMITRNGMTSLDGKITYSEEFPFIIRGEYIEIDAVEAMFHTFAENDDATRTPMNAVDIAEFIRLLSDTTLLNDSEIADKLGKPASYVSQHRKVLELDEATKNAIRSGEIKFNAAITSVAAIEPAMRAPAIARAKEQNNGRATANAIAQAAVELGAEMARPQPRNIGQLKTFLRTYINETPVGTSQLLAFAISDFLGGTVNEAALKAAFNGLDGNVVEVEAEVISA